MSIQLPSAGAATNELTRKSIDWWINAATAAGIDLKGFDPQATLEQRIAWAIGKGLDIAAALSRYSTKLQDSTETQIRNCLECAVRHKMYIPPEFVCIDEGEKGRRVRRDGLDRMKLILHNRHASTLIAFKVSRILRTCYKSLEYVNEEIVEEGLRVISVTQGIDTNDGATWKALLYMHGMMDELLLDTIADHCRAELETLFMQGYITGAIGVGYKRVKVPGAPPTKRGLPRTRPQKDKKAAKLIRKHFKLIAGGLPISVGWKQWVAEGGPCDPRSKLSHMSYAAYRRMLANRRLTGIWAFGRKRNRWFGKRDTIRQVDQPESEVRIYRCDELRIVSDKLFSEVQQRLADLKPGPRGPKQDRPVELWDLLTEIFFCFACSKPDHPMRFYQTGSGGVKVMHCKRGGLCSCKTNVRRKEAVLAICAKLEELIRQDVDLIEDTVCRAQQLDAQGEEGLQQEIDRLTARVRTLTHRASDLYELAGQGAEDYRKEILAKIRATNAERGTAEAELATARAALEHSTRTITPADVRRILNDFSQLLQDAGSGKLGGDAVYQAAEVIKRLTGRRVWVHVEQRAGRKRTVVRGTFRPRLLACVAEDVQSPADPGPAPEPVEVWLREPPLIDRLAERAYELVDVEDRSYRAAAKVLQSEGHDVNSGKVWQLRRRYYEMTGQPVPNRPADRPEPRHSA